MIEVVLPCTALPFGGEVGMVDAITDAVVEAAKTGHRVVAIEMTDEQYAQLRRECSPWMVTKEFGAEPRFMGIPLRRSPSRLVPL